MAKVKADKKLKISYIPYYGYEIDNLAFADKHKLRWTNVLKEKLEKEGHSFSTYDINTIKDSDYIISFDNTYFQNVRHFWNIWRAGKLGYTLHIDYEPPSAMIRIHSDRGLRVLSRLFTVMTYNDNVVNGKSIIKGVVGDYHERERPYKKDFNKRKLLCMVANNRNRKDRIPIKKWPSELYTEREETARFFSKKHSKDFDLYGDYWHDDIKTKGVVDRNKKLEVLSKYKFVVSYDSITRQNGYISEKIFDIFAAKCVPIYWGADNVTDYIPKKCFIDRRDFSSNEEVFEYLKTMTKKEYENRIAAIEEYLKSKQYNDVFSSESIANNIIANFIERKPRNISRIISLGILAWFYFIYRTNKHYSYDNYFFDVTKKSLKDPIHAIDKTTINNRHFFVVYANIGKEQSIYIASGGGQPLKIKPTSISSNEMYNHVKFDIPYEDIIKNSSVTIFIKDRNDFMPAKINQAAVINNTNYDEYVGFKVSGNKIAASKKLRFYARDAKILSGKIKRRMKRSHKPEIIYYPFIADPVISKDEPFNIDNGNHSWEQQLKILADTHGIEVHTPDKAKFKNVVGVLFFDNMFYHNVSALKDLHRKYLLRKTVYIDYEPPTGHAKKHEPESIKKLSQLFKAVATYDDNLAEEGNFIKCNVANFYAKQSKRQDFSKKKFAVMVTNNTTPDMIIHALNFWNNTDFYDDVKYHKKAIYHKRLEVTDYYYNNHPDKLDLFGTGYPDAYETFNKGFLDRSKKISTMSKYKFTIAFDSYTHQNGYISEKIFDAFFARTVPVYLGANNVTDYIPKQCFIDMRDFASYDDLHEYLSNMSKKEYDSRINAIEAFLKSDTFNKSFSSSAIAQKLFDTIVSDPIIMYDDAKAKKILDDLEVEMGRLSTKNPITPTIDKKLTGKKWSFVISIKASKNGKRLPKVFALVNNKKVKFKTYEDKHPQLKGNVCLVLPYEDIYNMRRIEFFVSMEGGKSEKLIFSPCVLRLINETHYDDYDVFYVDKNIIGCKKVLQ